MKGRRTAKEQEIRPRCGKMEDKRRRREQEEVIQ